MRKKVDLERSRKVFLAAGLMLSGSLTLLAFEWVTPQDYVKKKDLVFQDDDFYIEEDIQVIEEDEEIQPIKTPAVRPEIVNDNTVVIVDELPDDTPKIPDNIIIDDVFDLDVPIGIPVSGTPKVNPNKFNPEAYSERPMFPGGDKKMYEFIGNNVEFPYEALGMGVGGKLYVDFIVSKTGEVVLAKVKNKLGYGFDEAAIDVMLMMPKWKPAKQNGRPVDSRFRIPFKFIPQ